MKNSVENEIEFFEVFNDNSQSFPYSSKAANQTKTNSLIDNHSSQYSNHSRHKYSQGIPSSSSSTNQYQQQVNGIGERSSSKPARQSQYLSTIPPSQYGMDRKKSNESNLSANSANSKTTATAHSNSSNQSAKFNRKQNLKDLQELPHLIKEELKTSMRKSKFVLVCFLIIFIAAVPIFSYFDNNQGIQKSDPSSYVKTTNVDPDNLLPGMIFIITLDYRDTCF